MQLEINTEGLDFIASHAPQPTNDNDGPAQDGPGTPDAPLCVAELVAMDQTGTEVIKATSGAPR